MRWFAALCLLLFAGAAAAESRPEKFPVEAFGTRPFLASPAMSPDGAKVAALVDVKGKPALVIIHPADRSKGMRLVSVGEHAINWYRWAGSDRLVISLLMEGKYYGYDVYVTRLVSYQVSTGTPAQIGLQRQGFDGDDVIFFADDGSHILLSASKDIESNPGVYRVDLATLEMELVQRARDPIAEWFADRSGVVRAGLGYSGRRLRLIYREPGEEEFRTLANMRLEESDGEIETFRFVSSGDKGYAMSNTRTGRFGVYEFDWKTSELGKAVFEHPQVDVESFSMNDAGDAIEGVYYTDDRERVVWLDHEMKLLQAEIDAALPGRMNWVTSSNRDRTRFLVWSGAANDPGHYYHFNRATERMERLATPYEKLKDRSLAPVTQVSYQARDGLAVPAYLTLPLGREPKKLPLVVLPHGGPHVRDSLTFDYWVQFLANRGYAVLQPNFRGSSGYGREFMEKGFGQWGGAMQDDVTDGVQWLIGEGTVDPKRICIVGASYGGYAALMGAIKTPGLYRCAVSWAGVTDVNDMMRFDRNQMLPVRYRNWRNRVRGTAETDLRQVSPVHRAADVGVPVLLMHGTADDNVPYRQAESFVKSMKKAGKPLEFIEFPDVGHDIENTADRIRFLGAIETFLATHNPAD